MSSRSKYYVRATVCRWCSARLIITESLSPLPSPLSPLPFNGFRFTYLPAPRNERASPAPLFRRKAQTINIDFIISKIVLTKSYFPAATMCFTVGVEKGEKGRHPSLIYSHPRRAGHFPSHRSFLSRIYLLLIFAFFYCTSL